MPSWMQPQNCLPKAPHRLPGCVHRSRPCRIYAGSHAPALEEERKAGWAFYLHTTSDTPDGMVGVCHKTGEISHLFVTQSARGSGIGTKLLDFARKKTCGARPGPGWAVLDVNTAAIGLYRRMGYLPDGVRNLYQPGVDVAFCKPCKELVMRYQPQD